VRPSSQSQRYLHSAHTASVEGVHVRQLFSCSLGRLLPVDLIKPASMSVRTSVRPQKVFPIRIKFDMQVEVDE